MYEITVGGRSFKFVRPTIEFVKLAQVYDTKIQNAWIELFSDDGNVEEFRKVWVEFCNKVFQRDLIWRLRWFVFKKLPKELETSNMEFSKEKVEVREVLNFFRGLFVEILKGLNGQSKPSESSKQEAVESA